MYQLDPRGDAITVRAGEWFWDADLTIVFSGIEALLFLEPEAFLQFLMFTEWSASDWEEDANERVARIRNGDVPGSLQSRFAYSAAGHTPADRGAPEGANRTRVSRALRQGARPILTFRGIPADAGIDFIPDADAPVRGSSKAQSSRQMSPGKSVEIPLEERFGNARSEREELSRGKSVEIPLEERFENARREREKLSKGKSSEIPYDERRSGGDL